MISEYEKYQIDELREIKEMYCSYAERIFCKNDLILYLLYHKYGFSYREIARFINVSQPTVLRRIRKLGLIITRYIEIENRKLQFSKPTKNYAQVIGEVSR
jgi:predicted DNA-binding protein YlxM (UPF0122 family)